MTSIAFPSAIACNCHDHAGGLNSERGSSESRFSYSSAVSNSLEITSVNKKGQAYAYTKLSMSQEKAFSLLESRVAANSIDLQQIYQKISGSENFELSVAATHQSGVQQSPADKAVGNILGFIENRLALDKAAGASEEQLQSRLEAGMKGFRQGFSEAQSILKDMGLLDKKLDSEIGETYERVHQGGAELEQQYAPSLPAKTEAQPYSSINNGVESGDAETEAAKLVEINKVQSYESIERRQSVQVPAASFSSPAASSSASYQSLEFQRQQSFEFELTTKEGDKVSISAASFAEFGLQSEQAQADGANYSALSFQSANGKEFALAVEGDLSKDELAAINQLLEQVVDLAGDFYSGDLGGAFAKAMELGYDSSQISEFSLNLSQSSQARAVAAYEQIQPASPWERPSIGQGLDKLGSFVKDLVDSVDTAKSLSQPSSLITDLLSQQVQELEASDKRMGEKPSDLLQELLNDLDIA